jgi:hypothetical protein
MIECDGIYALEWVWWKVLNYCYACVRGPTLCVCLALAICTCIRSSSPSLAWEESSGRLTST